MINRSALDAAGQGHLVDALQRLDGEARDTLASQIAALDLPLISRLIQTVARADHPVDLDGLQPAEVVGVPTTPDEAAADRAATEAGAELLSEGRVAAVLLAGGQGTRLGFDGPKGEYPFSPVSQTTLFAHHAARIHALRRRFGAVMPWYIMTSPHNDAATRAHFDAHNWFELPRDTVRIFQQGVLPAVDLESGRILLEAPDRIALSPDGHGGIFPALAKNGVLDEMAALGIRTFVTYNVDNPMGRVPSPQFVGHHARADADISVLIVRKHRPEERVGVVARLHDRAILVEYSDLPDELAQQRSEDGTLRYWAGSVNSHAIQCDFARQVTAGLPYHRAVKRVPYVDADGTVVNPSEPNAVKFEAFMFDALPLATRSTVIEALREDEFSPIKNAEGEDSPHTMRRDMNRMYARWLRAAGVDLQVSPEGDPQVDIEIDPRFALDEHELRERLPAGFTPEPGRPIVLR